MTPTIVEVAKKANVSKSAVSDILNRSNKHNYTAETISRVEQAAEKLGYEVNQFAKSLKTGKTNIIGITTRGRELGQFNFLYTTKVYQGISDFFVQYDYKLIFHNFNDLTRSRQPLDLVKSKLVDGLIFVRFSIDIRQFMNEELPVLQRINKPFVVIHSLKEDLGITSVGLDCVHGGLMATAHLIQHGYQTIGCVTQPGPHCEDLFLGYRQALEQHHVPLREEFVYALAGQTSDEASALAERLLQDKSKLPRALFVVDEYWAYPMIKKFWAAGVRIPQDLAIISFGDVNSEAVALTDLTMVRQPAVEKGYKASEFLLAQLHKNERTGAHQFHVFKPALTVNRSCGCGPNSK